MRAWMVVVLFAVIAVGCARGTTDPAAPSVAGNGDEQSPAGYLTAAAQPDDGPYRLWGEWEFIIDETHENIDVVPRRTARFHLNVLRFLEEYCTNCLQIMSIQKNADETIDLTVRITHPFPGHPEYTGFDVKGIIMFQGSHEFTGGWSVQHLPLYPLVHRASWRLLGDPELLNADGYSYRWSPWYESGSDMPIFNYWPGKYSNGTPTANINGYLNFYSNEERHMFESGAQVTRTYHIWLPPGQPVVAGYAVEACWVPPLTTPVTDPAADFPITANQPEAYHFHCVLNDGKPITKEDPCCLLPISVHEARAEMDFWYLVPETLPESFWVQAWSPEIAYYAAVTQLCDGPPNWRCFGTFHPFGQHPEGIHQFIAFEWHVWEGDPSKPKPYVAVDLFEIVIDHG